MGIVLISAYFASLSPLALFRALPGSIAQGLIWGLLALGVYITYKLLDFADLSVDGSFATGGAVAVMLIRSDMNPWVSLIFAFAAGMLAEWSQVFCTPNWEFLNSCRNFNADCTVLHQSEYYGTVQSGDQCG